MDSQENKNEQIEKEVTRYILYHRTSTKEQHLDRGVKELKDYCKLHNIKIYNGKVFTDQQTGKNFERPSYKAIKEYILQPGDVLMVTELDRLGRDKKDTMKEIQYFKDNNIRLMVLELPTTLMNLEAMQDEMAKMMLEMINNMMLELYASLAHAEILKKEKRQREGIAAKKARGDWDNYGRPRLIDFKEFSVAYMDVLAGRKTPKRVIEELEISHSAYYRYRKEYHEKLKIDA